jgi:hypothetical protein
MFDRRKDNRQVSPLKATFVVLLITTPGTWAGRGSEMSPCTQIWDTVSPFGDRVDVVNRADWKPVPCNLLSLESNPAAAVSDPAYYGREYSFEGDAVVENAHYLAVFHAAKGRVIVYSKVSSGGKAFELVPLQLKNRACRIKACRILQNTGNEAALEVTFSAGAGSENLSAVISFDKTEIVGVKPAEHMKGVSIFSPVAHGVVPDFISDDLVLSPQKYASADTLYIPLENLFMGLLEEQDRVLVVTWAEGKQKMKLELAKGQSGRRLVESIDFENDGRSIYLAVLSAAGIWHDEELKANYLEKDIAMGWKRPFHAKWTTQLFEAGVRTTFTFRQSKDDIWRGVTGHYAYPIWFDGQDAYCRLSKKIPPRGDAIIYFVEGKGTPGSITTPVDILKAALGRQASETILDFPGRRLRTHHRRGSVGIRRSCTCGGTEAIEAVFKAGQEVEMKEYVAGSADDMVYFVTRHVERIDEYREFANRMTEYLNATRKSAANLKPFLDDMQAIVQEIPQQYTLYKENMKTLAYADELARKIKALTRMKSSGNLPACLELGKQWRAMGGAQDNVIALYHNLARKLAQEAGYGCAERPEAVEVAKEIRRRCRQCLRNADGYEIWPDY